MIRYATFRARSKIIKRQSNIHSLVRIHIKISERDPTNKARWLLNQMNSLKTALMVELWTEILEIFDKMTSER